MKRINGMIGIIAPLIFVLSVAAVHAENNPLLSATLLTQNPNPANAGDTVEVNIQLQNTGGESSPQVLGEIIPEFPFTVAPGQSAQQIVGVLPNYPSQANYKILRYTLLINKDAIDKNYELKFRFSENGGVSWTVETFNVKVTSNKYAQIISVDKTKINPGEETPLTFTINNIGRSPLNNLIFTWSEPNNIILPVGTDNTRYIPYIGIGENQQLTYTVVANPSATRGLYNLNLKLTFDAMNSTSGSVQSTKIETSAGVMVGGSTDFDIALSDSTSGSTSLSIANIGSNPATSVSVTIPEQPGWKVSGSNSVIIGNLNQGDYTIASFKLQSMGAMTYNRTRNTNQGAGVLVNFSSTSSENLKVEIAFTDTMGNRVKLDKVIPLSLQSIMGNTTPLGSRGATTQTSMFSKYWYVFVLVLVVLAYFGYQRYKKVKSEKNNFKWKDLLPRKTK